MMPAIDPWTGVSASRLPDTMDRPTLVTPGSSDGSTPLIVRNWLPPALFASPSPSTTGAAATTRGTARTFLTSSSASPSPPALST